MAPRMSRERLAEVRARHAVHADRVECDACLECDLIREIDAEIDARRADATPMLDYAAPAARKAGT